MDRLVFLSTPWRRRRYSARADCTVRGHGNHRNETKEEKIIGKRKKKGLYFGHFRCAPYHPPHSLLLLRVHSTEPQLRRLGVDSDDVDPKRRENRVVRRAIVTTRPTKQPCTVNLLLRLLRHYYYYDVTHAHAPEREKPVGGRYFPPFSLFVHGAQSAILSTISRTLTKWPTEYNTRAQSLSRAVQSRAFSLLFRTLFTIIMS